jgi:hypothetical protein
MSEKKGNTWTLYNDEGKQMLNYSPEEMVKSLRGISPSFLASQGYWMVDNNTGKTIMTSTRIEPQKKNDENNEIRGNEYGED